MSQHKYATETTDGTPVLVTLGYDRILDYVFCYVERSGDEPLYSSHADEEAGTHQHEADYFRLVLADLGITVPDTVYAAGTRDQLQRVGNSLVTH